MSNGAFGRRAFLLGLLATVTACAQPEPPAPVAVTPPDPEPERVYAPGPIAWAELSDEHKRRAQQGLTRMGEDVPDEETLQARWMTMSPAQQRYLIRRPPPPPPRPRPTSRGRAPARGRSAPRRGSTPARRGSAPATTTRQRRR